MSIETIETIDTSAAERRALKIGLRLDTIAENYEVVMGMIREAIDLGDHNTLGYASPGAYLADRFGGALGRLPVQVRRAAVHELTAAGLSTRAIAPVLGVSNYTVSKDRQSAESAGVRHLTPAQPPTIATAEGVVIAEQRHVALDVTDLPEDLHEPTPEPKPITGMDGKTYPSPEPKPVRRNPLPDQFASASLNLTRAVARLVTLSGDDRLPQNREKVATANRSDLLRAIDALQRVVASLD